MIITLIILHVHVYIGNTDMSMDTDEPVEGGDRSLSQGNRIGHINSFGSQEVICLWILMSVDYR
jgi:hypothetical protein